jgi:hypothetical protein
MMPVIRINDATFMDLKSISTWLGTTTPSEAINALVREKMEALDLERDISEESATAEKTSDGIVFQNTPGLTHTRILSATLNGKTIENINWAGLLVKISRIVKDKGLSKEQLSVELQVPAESFQITERGYKFYPELGVSIQGQSAPDAWRETQRLAQKYKIPVEVKFQWREKDGAQYPGKVGILRAGAV